MFKSKGSHAKRQLFSGYDIIVKDSRIGRIYDLKVYGKSYQRKNLLPIRMTSQTQNGITITSHGDGTYTVNGTATGNIQYYLLVGSGTGVSSYIYPPAGDYILTGCPQGGSATTYHIELGHYRPGASPEYVYPKDTGDGYAFTLSQGQGIRVYIGVRQGVTMNNLIFKPMLRRADTSPDFEPGDGGRFMPEAPSEILNVPSEIDFINRSKNLINLDSDNIAPLGFYTQNAGTSQPIYKNYDIIIGTTRNGIINNARLSNWDIDQDNYIIQFNSVESGYGIGFRIKDFIVGQSYRGSFDCNVPGTSQGGVSTGFGAFDKDGNLIAHSVNSIIVPEGTVHLFAVFHAWGTATNQDVIIQYPQVEQGTVSTAFVPYYRNVTPITIKDADNNLHMLGKWDYVDYLTGKIVKGSGVVVLDGDEAWTQVSIDSERILFECQLPNAKSEGECLCTQAIYERWSGNPYSCYISYNGKFRIMALKSDFSDSYGWRTHLAISPMVVVYELASPEIYELHPTEKTNKPYTIDGDNYITTETDNGVKPDLEFRAISYHYGK